MKRRLAPAGLVALLAWNLAPAAAQDKADAEKARALASIEPRIRSIYERQEFAPRSFRVQWVGGGSAYVVLEPTPESPGPDLVRYDPAADRREVLLTGRRFAETAAAPGASIRSVTASRAGDRFLIQASHGATSAYWLLDPKSGSLRGVESELGELLGPETFSPEGDRLLFRRGANLHVLDLATGKSLALTEDGGGGTIENGDSACWSPDGTRVAYIQSDSSRVRRRPFIEPTDPTYPSVRMERYARVGTPIPTLRVGVVNAAGGATKWLELPGKPGAFYINDVSWLHGPAELLVETASRGRDARAFLVANAETGAVKTLYEETDPAWVDSSVGANAGLDWIKEGREFLLISERDGWRHAYVGSRDGGEPRLLTKGDFDVVARGPVDEANGWFYYIASPDNATQRYLFRVRLDGSSPPERVTPADEPGTHAYDVSPDRRWAVHTYSTFDTPPVVDLVELPAHRSVRTMEDNAAIRERLRPWVVRPTEFLKLDVGGVAMDAWMIRPREFDPARKYPVFVFVYGEPHGQTVLDDWHGGQNHTMFHRAVADLGYLVVSIDNRGTPAPKGAAWRRAVYGSLGPLSTDEQAAALRELARVRPEVDLDRVGIWGWSGGGTNTLNALFRKPELYRVGIAVAPKPQPQLYNAWFQEIYMRTPEENPDGYRRAAAINFAEGLRGDLLIVHGSGERNTHLPITEGLVDRLIELGKPFDFMVYPNRDHGLREGKGTPVHLRMLIARYLLEHLPPGPR